MNPNNHHKMTQLEKRDILLHKIRSGTFNLQTDFFGADLTDGDLSGVNLNGANLMYANLANVNFTGATLLGVTFDNTTNLFEANFKNAIFDCDTLQKLKEIEFDDRIKCLPNK